jgi:hypothetical protein
MKYKNFWEELIACGVWYIKYKENVSIHVSIKRYNLGGCIVGITAGSDLWSTPLRWPQMVLYTCQDSWRLVRRSDNIKVISSTIWESSMLVLLTGNVYDVWHWDNLKWHDMYILHKDRFRNSSNIKVVILKTWEIAELAPLITKSS